MVIDTSSQLLGRGMVWRCVWSVPGFDLNMAGSILINSKSALKLWPAMVVGFWVCLRFSVYLIFRDIAMRLYTFTHKILLYMIIKFYWCCFLTFSIYGICIAILWQIWTSFKALFVFHYPVIYLVVMNQFTYF